MDLRSIFRGALAAVALAASVAALAASPVAARQIHPCHRDHKLVRCAAPRPLPPRHVVRARINCGRGGGKHGVSGDPCH